MIVAISSIKNEADIIHHTVTHLLGEGVDTVLLSVGESDDNTYEYAMSLPNSVHVARQEGPFDQGAEMTRLAQEAFQHLGATWIIPFDADEFWYGDDGRSVRDVIRSQPKEITRIHAPVYPHTTRDDRYVTPKTWGKVAFRPHPEMTIAWGNHTVFNGHGESIHGVLAIRELQYRDFAHFKAKMAKSRDLFDSWDVPMEHGSHMRQLLTLAPDDVYPAYQAYMDAPTTHDPIPYRGAPWT